MLQLSNIFDIDFGWFPTHSSSRDPPLVIAQSMGDPGRRAGADQLKLCEQRSGAEVVFQYHRASQGHCKNNTLARRSDGVCENLKIFTKVTWKTLVLQFTLTPN